MKKKVLTTVLIAAMTFSLAACGGQEDAVQSGTDVQESQSKEQTELAVDDKNEQNESEETLSEENSVVDLTGNYLLVDTEYVDEIDYSQNELTFMNAEESFTIKGYACGNFQNGVAIARVRYEPGSAECIISKEGEELVPLGKYDSLTRVGSIEVRNYFVARDVASQKYGVIDALGKEIVPFEYDEIRQFELKKDIGDSCCIYRCKKGDTSDCYWDDGMVMQKGYSSSDISLDPLYVDEQGNIMFQLYVAGEAYYFCEGIEGCLSKPEDYKADWSYRGERIFSYVATDGETKMVCFSEDWQSMEPLKVIAGNCTWIGDNLFVTKVYSGAYLYDKDWNIVQSSSANLGMVRDYAGNVCYIDEGITYFNKKAPTIYNEKFEEVKEIENCKRLYSAGGLLYAFPLEDTEGTHDLYDIYGNLLYKNITLKSYDYDKNFIKFLTEDGIFGYKTADMPEVALADEGETLKESDALNSWFCFVNESGQYVFRDENMNLIAIFDEEVSYQSEYEVFRNYRKGQYYNLQGELIYEE